MRAQHDQLKLQQSLEGEEKKAVEREINNAVRAAFVYSHVGGGVSQSPFSWYECGKVAQVMGT